MGTENFAKVLPYQVVSLALNILGKGKAGLNAALAILGTENFAKVLPAEIVSHALKIVGAEEAGRKAAGAIVQTEDFASVLPHSIISHALNILGNTEAGRTAAQKILDTENFATVLPVEVVGHALTILGKSEAGRTAAQKILDTENFATVLPFEVVSHALKILAHEAIGRTAALEIFRIEKNLLKLPKEVVAVALNVAEECQIRSAGAVYLLEHADRTHTFLQFAALRALAATHDVSLRETVGAYVTKLMNGARPTPALFRLRHDLLYLPLSWVPAHARLLRRIVGLYGSDCAARIRWDVFKILNCRLRHGPQANVENDVIELCRRVVCECVADVDHQWRVDSRDLKFGQIWTAAQILDDPLTTADVLARLNDYAAQHVDIAQTKEFRNLLSFLEKPWESESHATDDFKAV